ncbi:MAG: peptidylprolyl isomerase [Coriobacteriia bacterium]|nr:peptidylprolyl isomerase [Coriobacteriia bacterium]
MAPESGETVRVHYRGTLSDGTEFDSSKGRDPLEFKLGEGQVIPGFESHVSSLRPGESATFTIPAQEAYGERVESATQPVPKDAFQTEPEVGWQVQLTSRDGRQVMAQVAEIEDEEVVLDFNHPLAGEDLTFEVTLVAVEGR